MQTRMRPRRPWGLLPSCRHGRGPLVIAHLSDRGRPLADDMSRKSDAVNGEHFSAAPRSLAKRSRILRIQFENERSWVSSPLVYNGLGASPGQLLLEGILGTPGKLFFCVSGTCWALIGAP